MILLETRSVQREEYADHLCTVAVAAATTDAHDETTATQSTPPRSPSSFYLAFHALSSQVLVLQHCGCTSYSDIQGGSACQRSSRVNAGQPGVHLLHNI